MVEYVNALVALYGSDEAEGQGLVEYALILVLISVVSIALMTALGTRIGAVFTAVTTALTP